MAARRQGRTGGVGAPLLWTLAVGAAIDGQFGGWNLGLASGGFGGLVLAAAIVAAMYLCLAGCLGEMLAAAPGDPRGAQAFAEAARRFNRS